MEFPKRTFVGLSKILDDINTRLQSALLPSGAIIWFNRTTAPSGWVICNGTNGTPNLIGRYPLGSTSGIGTAVEASLPNITGNFTSMRRYSGIATGAFRIESSAAAVAHPMTYDPQLTYSFDASRCSSVYKNSATTVTPPSVKLLPCMKL